MFVVTLLFANFVQAAEPGWYLGGGVGEYRIKVDDTDFDEDAKILRILGGYQLNRYIAFEAEFQRLFESSDDRFAFDNEVDANLYGIAIRPILPLTDSFDLYGRAGWARFELNESIRVFGVGVDTEELGSDTAFSWGVGAAGHFARLTLRGEFSKVELDGSDLELLSLNLLYRF